MVATALIVMVTAVVAQHLGLSDAIAKVLGKILRCPRCLSFWTVLFVLTYLGNDVIPAIGLSLAMAYLSEWVAIPLKMLNDIFDYLWQKANRKR